MLAIFSSAADKPEARQPLSREFKSVGVETYIALTSKSTPRSGQITRLSRRSEARQRYSADDDHSQHADGNEKTNHFFPRISYSYAFLRITYTGKWHLSTPESYCSRGIAFELLDRDEDGFAF
jgi:hypothetical protein